jgi:hypothetical protein
MKDITSTIPNKDDEDIGVKRSTKKRALVDDNEEE